MKLKLQLTFGRIFRELRTTDFVDFVSRSESRETCTERRLWIASRVNPRSPASQVNPVAPYLGHEPGSLLVAAGMKRQRIDDRPGIIQNVRPDHGQPSGFIAEALGLVDEHGDVVIGIGPSIAMCA